MRILNFGSLNLDYVYEVDHFVRPGETLSSLKREIFCGGKGLNQSVALARADAPVFHAGCIGQEGTALVDLLNTCGVDTRFVKRAESANGHAIIQVDQKGQNSILLFGGANETITEEQIENTLDFFDKGDMLVLQNEINGLDILLCHAQRKGLTVALNPSPFDDRLLSFDLSSVNYFILNEIEGKELTGETEPSEILRKMAERYPHCKVVLTLGKDGSVYQDGSTVYHQPIYSVEVVDTTAAGDTFLGYFLAGISQGQNPSQALDMAARAAALAVSQKGASVSIPTLKQVANSRLD